MLLLYPTPEGKLRASADLQIRIRDGAPKCFLCAHVREGMAAGELSDRMALHAGGHQFPVESQVKHLKLHFPELKVWTDIPTPAPIEEKDTLYDRPA